MRPLRNVKKDTMPLLGGMWLVLKTVLLIGFAIAAVLAILILADTYGREGALLCLVVGLVCISLLQCLRS